MAALDGNAIAGPLFEYFGAEVTTARGSCRHCGTAAVIAELRVYARGPGTVVRCRSCGNVVIVLTMIRNTLRVDLRGFHLLEAPGDS
jgi:ribosomal protein L40E